MTPEGEVDYESGDAIVTGITGESWPVPKETFFQTYTPIPPLQAGAEGRYVKRPIPVLALQLQMPACVHVGRNRDPLHGQPGDWLVQRGARDQWIVGREVFDRTYERINE